MHPVGVPVTAAERETGVADGAADPLADVRRCSACHRDRTSDEIRACAAYDDPLCAARDAATSDAVVQAESDWTAVLDRHRLGSHDLTQCDACFIKAGLVVVEADRDRKAAALDAERAARERAEAESRHNRALRVEAFKNARIAKERAERAEAAIARARALHQPYDRDDVAALWPEWLYLYDEGERWCRVCSHGNAVTRMPCSTAAALETETPA